MKVRALACCVLLSILVLLFLSTAVQAGVYSKSDTEVQAEDILMHIDNGDDIVIDNCSIVGEFNVSRIKNTIPNPYYTPPDENISKYRGIVPEATDSPILYVIVSNITIRNSTFEDEIDFSYAQVKSEVNFERTTFNSSAKFFRANFSSFADFRYVIFNSFADFRYVIFNSSADFSYVIFNSSADFFWVLFKEYTDFSSVKFNSYANFYLSDFFSDVDFDETNFSSDVNFSHAKLKKDADFSHATFNSDAKFKEPSIFKRIITDDKCYSLFMKAYNDKARYSDADKIYYYYRLFNLESENSVDSIINILSWVTCGFGTKLSYPLTWTVFFVIIFAIIYKNPRVSLKNKNTLIPIRLYWGEPGIYRKEKLEEESVSFLESLYFSTNIFTRLGSNDWQQKDSFRKWVSLEGVLGWIIFALVSATLMRLFIRL